MGKQPQGGAGTPTWSVGRLCPHFPTRPQAGLGRGRARAPAQALCPSPAGSSLSSESSPVSSPATNHSSPASTPKRVPMGPIIVPPGGHSVPSTPPVVTIAPTKTVNGVWRSESRQVSGGLTGAHFVLRSASPRGSWGTAAARRVCVSQEHSQGSWSGAAPVSPSEWAQGRLAIGLGARVPAVGKARPS